MQSSMEEEITDKHVHPIRSYHGERSIYCKDCRQFRAVKERVTGRMAGVYTEEPIFVDEIWGECGHILRDDSH